MPEGGTVLAFDFGIKRTGVSSGELGIGVAHPLTVIQTDSAQERFNRISRLIKEWQPIMLVVGLPRHPDGTEHELSRAARNFAAKLENRFKLPVFLADERYTSQLAGEALHDAGVHGKKNRDHLDAVAAQLILQGFFDARLTT
ncbi:MAG: Holliday junction resolvase RuvX [Thiobacillaceae bacterium]